MTRLKRLLLAGTVLPALTAAPLAPGWAQAPEPERHGPRGAGPQHSEAPPHAGGPASRGDAAPSRAEPPNRAARGEREAAPAHEGARPAPGGPANHGAAAPVEHGRPAANERGREAPKAAERQQPAAGTRGPADGHDAPARADAGHREGRPERNGEAAHPATPSRNSESARPGAAADHVGEPPHSGPAATRNREATRPGTPPARTDDAARPGVPPARTGDTARPGTPATRANDAARPGVPPARTEDTTRPGTPATRTEETARPGAPHGAGEAGRAPGRGEANRPDAATRAGEAARPGAAATPGGEAAHPGQSPAPAAAQNRPGPGAPNPGEQSRRGIGPGGAAAIGAAAGFAGGFLAATGAQHLDEIRRDRREFTEDGRTYIREPGRTIVEDNGHAYIVHDEGERFRELGYNVRRERSGRDTIDVIDRPGGVRILTFTDPDGRMIRRVRRYPDGHEVVLIDNGYDGRVRPPQDDIVDLPPPSIDIPRDRYIVDYADADENVIYDTFEAPPLQPPPQRYTLDQIRYSPDIRRYVRSVDINTINFDTGSWVVPASATGKLRALGTAIKRAVDRNPNAVFLVEGFTDATGNPTDNLSLSDRRAQSVATILSRDFGVPPENLTTQGYGQQNLKVNTQGSSAANRRVVVQNITPLLAAGGAPPR